MAVACTFFLGLYRVRISSEPRCVRLWPKETIAFFLQVLFGFPPKPLELSNDEWPIGAAGLADHETLVVRDVHDRLRAEFFIQTERLDAAMPDAHSNVRRVPEGRRM